jgi:hypothetical protein
MGSIDVAADYACAADVVVIATENKKNYEAESVRALTQWFRVQIPGGPRPTLSLRK